MSLVPVTLSNATDTWVGQTRPNVNYSDGTYLRMSAASGAAMYSYIYFARPFPLGATVTSAVLHLRQASGTLSGSRTVTAKRALQHWPLSRLTYGNQPTIDTVVAASTAKTASTAGTVWDFDITTMMQTVASGTSWFGLRLETTDTSPLLFWSAQATSLKPTLDVTWTEAPQAPSTLTPSGGGVVSLAQPTVTFDFTDHIGNTTQQAVQVQANPTNVWTSPAFDSDVVQTSATQLDLSQTFPILFPSTTTTSGSTNITTTATLPIFDQADVGSKITGTGIPANATLTAVAANGLSATLSAAATASGTITATVIEAFAAMADGASMYWRVRVQDAAGLWSPWSLGALFTRTTKGTLSITNPAASPNNFVSEATPPISWTFTGRTQATYQVILQDANGSWLWHSGKITGTANTMTLPAGYIHNGRTYTIAVRVWDTPRVKTPGDPVWTEVTRTFTFNLSATVAAVTSFTGTDLTPIPSIQLDWTRTTAPDSYTIVRYQPGDTVKPHIAAGLIPSDLLVSGTAYRYIDRGADPNIAHVWEVWPVVNGITGSAAPTVTKTLKPVGIWLLDPATGVSVQLVGSDNGTWSSGEEAEVYTPVGGTKVVRVTQALRGFEGSITGEFISFGTTSVATSIANMYTLKANAGATLWLTFADMCIPVVIGNVNVAPIRGADVRKTVTFDFWQVGNLPFNPSL